MRRDVIILFFSSPLFNAKDPRAHILSTEILGGIRKCSFLWGEVGGGG